MQASRMKKDDFESIDTIGRGNFGEVQVVRRKATGEIFAMKTLKKIDTLDQSHVAFFQHERDIMASANNEWITGKCFHPTNNIALILHPH